MRELLLVATGSAIGGVLRFLTGKWITQLIVSSFPWPTFLVNIIGSFFIGLFLAMQSRSASISQQTLLFLTTGICGGFTTFSAFSLEQLNLIRHGNAGIAVVYALVSVLIGLLAAWLGFHAVR